MLFKVIIFFSDGTVKAANVRKLTFTASFLYMWFLTKCRVIFETCFCHFHVVALHLVLRGSFYYHKNLIGCGITLTIQKMAVEAPMETITEVTMWKTIKNVSYKGVKSNPAFCLRPPNIE